MPKVLHIAWLNGRFLPIEEARISPLDRGFLYGDGVYEVIPVYNGKPFETAAHLQRLQRSLESIGLDDGMANDEWQEVLDTLIERNGLQDAALYLQITRGATDGRDHVFPTEPVPTVFAMATARSSNPAATGSAITLEDIRWRHNHIKATSLLGNVLLRQAAAEAGAAEAILLRDGCAIEASSSNLFIVTDGVLVTPELQPHVLAGITRQVILSVASDHGIPVEERCITETELREADEVWVASSMREILPITELDGMPVGNGQPSAILASLKPAFAARTSA
jgi:D-alanine transaminase